MVESRLADVNNLYSTTQTPIAIRLLRKYGVKYIYVSELEHLYYPNVGLQKLDGMVGSLLDIAYQNGPVRTYQVKD